MQKLQRQVGGRGRDERETGRQRKLGKEEKDGRGGKRRMGEEVGGEGGCERRVGGIIAIEKPCHKY